jgi:teichuronic acid biosynthesis glycosyltransferase TuaC
MTRMRILVLTKRQYMNKDLLSDRYGRFRELPLALAKQGHEVIGICLSYRHRPEEEIIDTDARHKGEAKWLSMNIGPFLLPGLMRYVRHAIRLVCEFKPDVILACSDGIYGILGKWIGYSTNTRCVFDLYDNFESFGSTRFTGLLPLYRWAVRNADGIVCISEPLRSKVVNQYHRTLPVTVIENAIRSDIFFPRDPQECRKQLGLPSDAIIIGTAGALYKNRGIDALFRGFEHLASEDNRIHLAIAGSRDHRTRIPAGSHVHDLGMLAQADVPLLINSLDVAVICNLDSEFGRYCFPQKAYEILSCHRPLVAANVGVMKDLLADYPNSLFIPDNPIDLSRAVRNQLLNPTVADVSIPTWDNLAEKLNIFLQSICGSYAR